VRTPEVESVIASAGDLAASSYQTYKVLVNGELRFNAVRAADGQEIAVDQGTIYGLTRQPERSVRASAWAAYADGYLGLRQTLAGLLGAAFRRRSDATPTWHRHTATLLRWMPRWTQ
jgi:oligoendopeptidase F